MPLLDDLLRSGGELLDDKGGEWFDKATAAARDELPAVVELASSAGVEVTEDQAAELLNEAAKGKAPILRLGSVGFAWVVAHLESDDEAEARRRYLEHQATFEERRAAMHAAGDRAQDDEGRPPDSHRRRTQGRRHLRASNQRTRPAGLPRPAVFFFALRRRVRGPRRTPSDPRTSRPSRELEDTAPSSTASRRGRAPWRRAAPRRCAS